MHVCTFPSDMIVVNKTVEENGAYKCGLHHELCYLPTKILASKKHSTCQLHSWVKGKSREIVQLVKSVFLSSDLTVINPKCYRIL